MTSRKTSTQRKLFDFSSAPPIVIHDSDDEEGERKRSDVAFPVAKRHKKSTANASSVQSTPAPEPQNQTAVVTPADVKTKDLYVPKYIHRNVEYSRQGIAKLSLTTQRAFEWIKANVNLPEDLEQNRIYGPLSGTSYEERAIRAYRLGLIKARSGSDRLCTACANVGHSSSECPELV